MNRTEIELKGKKVEILFGCWSIGQLFKSGIDLSSRKGEDLYFALPDIAYFGACNAKGRDLGAFDINDFHDAPVHELMKVLPVFNNSMTQDVPSTKSEKEDVSGDAKKQPRASSKSAK